MEPENKTTTSVRLRMILEERGLKQSDLVRMCAPYAREFGVSMGRSSISQYVTGKSLPAQRQLSVLSSVLNVSEAWLMGFDVPRERVTRQTESVDVSAIPGIMPIRRKSFPLLGTIACGEPTYAEEQHETWIEATESIDADFCIRASGDSMSGAHIEDGDIVFIKQMPVVDNGRIAAVCIGDETTLKYCDYRPETATLILTPANPAYRPQIYTGEQLNAIRILGLAVKLQKDLIK